jgi:hypothetical protein
MNLPIGSRNPAGELIVTTYDVTEQCRWHEMCASIGRRQQRHKTNGAIDGLGNSRQWETKQSILAAIEESQHTADKEKNRKVGEFAYNLRIHEDLEDEVIYPAVILIGKYLQERLTPYDHHAFA